MLQRSITHQISDIVQKKDELDESLSVVGPRFLKLHGALNKRTILQ